MKKSPMRSRTGSSQQGLSLTELSVTIAIIGLLIAGTLGGNALLQTAKIRKTVTEFTHYRNVVTEFSQSYRHMPGDMPNAVAVIGAAGNGNGDGIVAYSSAPSEDLLVWNHLTAAGLTGGVFSGVEGADKYTAGENAPVSETYGNAVFAFYTHNTQIYGTRGHAIRLAAIDAGEPLGGFLTAKQAQAIDLKIDDGKASSGMFYTIRDGTGCVDAAPADASAGYNLQNNDEDCVLLYWQRKF